ncbi:hypothetical protein ANO11243_082980 [Dothideomycetidae sp. 11243]|nr:hypothetical protein ANO11243_082980 [fungal sp. No.11243]
MEAWERTVWFLERQQRLNAILMPSRHSTIEAQTAGQTWATAAIHPPPNGSTTAAWPHLRPPHWQSAISNAIHVHQLWTICSTELLADDRVVIRHVESDNERVGATRQPLFVKPHATVAAHASGSSIALTPP